MLGATAICAPAPDPGAVVPALAAARCDAPGEAGRAVERMLRAAPHRGTWTQSHTIGSAAIGVGAPDAGGDVSLAHDAGLAVAMVGRVDNHHELVTRLGVAASTEPAHLIRLLFREHGLATPALLRGSYVVAITDGSQVHCFRDHLGLRSLFYRADGREVTVASEAKQVAAGAGIPLRPDAEVVSRILFNRLDDSTPAAFTGVLRLPKATLLTTTDAGTRAERYWHPERLLEQRPLPPRELQERFDELMTQAVARMVTGRDAVALSGGVDSPAVAAYAAPVHLARSGEPLLAITKVYPDYPTVDEREYTEAAARYIGIPLVTYQHEIRHLDELERWIPLLDGPVPSWSGNETVELYKQVRAHGRTTVLTGEIAELLVDINRNLVPHLLLHGRFRALGRRLVAQHRNGTSLPRIGRQLAAPFMPRRLGLELRRRGLVYRPHPVPEWLEKDHYDPTPRVAHVPAAQRWRWDQLRGFEGPGVTFESEEIRQDICGVTVRTPFGDVDLWEFFLGLPAEQKSPGLRHKSLLRQLFRGKVPDVLLDRKDKTFFNAAILGNIEYPVLRRWLIDSDIRIPGVRYDALARRLAEEDFGITDYVWARDLAVAHAFLAQWPVGPAPEPSLR